MSQIGAKKGRKQKGKKVTERVKLSVEDQIKELEQQISKTKYNKKTQHAIGLYKAQLARLKEKQRARVSNARKAEGFAVRKTGDGTVIIVGFPSSGKSTLLNALTNAKSDIGYYAFTTLKVVPAIMKYKYAQIQVLDVPGIVKGAADGSGRGREVLAVMRNADLVLLLIDVNSPRHYKALTKEIYESGLRLNQTSPYVKITRTKRGGVKVSSTVKLKKMDKKTVGIVMKEFKLNNSDIIIRENITPDQLIDVIEANKKYVPAITVLTKIDSVNPKKLEQVKRGVKPDLCISAEQDINIEELRELIFKKLNLIRIYCKQVGKRADLVEPLILFRNATIKGMCEKLHKDFVDKFKFARVWGSSRFPGQKLMLNYILKDGDIVEIHLR